jgi:hypothetical protein
MTDRLREVLEEVRAQPAMPGTQLPEPQFRQPVSQFGQHPGYTRCVESPL